MVEVRRVVSKAVWMLLVLVPAGAYAAPGAPGQAADVLPDAPVKQPPSVPEPEAGDAIYAPLAVGQSSARIKLQDYVVRTFGPRAVVSPAFTAAIRMAHPPGAFPREWKDGAEAFGRNYGEVLASRVALETGRTGAALLLHEDFRYRRSPTATGFGRLFHAVGYTFIDQSDSGHPRLAVSNFVGAAAGGFTAAAILPDGYNSVSNGAKDSALRFGGLAFQNVAREYAPEVARFFQSLHLPFPHVPFPEWYTKGLGTGRAARTRGTATATPGTAPAATPSEPVLNKPAPKPPAPATSTPPATPPPA